MKLDWGANVDIPVWLQSSVINEVYIKFLESLASSAAYLKYVC